MKKILIFSILVFLVVFYAYFQVYLKKQEDEFPKTVLIEKQKLVGFRLTTAFSEIQMKLESDLWHLVQPHSYPADQMFVEQCFEIMTQAPVLSTFPLKEDHFGLKPGKALMEFIYINGLRRRLIIGSKQGPQNGLYILDKDSGQVFLVHSVFGQFLYHPLSMFFHKNLPIPGKKIQSLKMLQSSETVQSPEILWEIKKTDQSDALIRLGDQSGRVPKEKLFLFFKKLREFQIKDHQFKKPKSFKKTISLFIKTDKASINFDFDDKTGQIHSETQNVFARFEPSSLTALSDELKKVMKNKK